MRALVRDKLARHRQFLAFCGVGATGVLVNMAVFEATLWSWARTSAVPATSTLAINAAAVAGWLVSVASNFYLNDVLTFAHRAADFRSSRRRRLVRYYATAASGLAVQLAVLNGVLLALQALFGPAGAAAGVGAWLSLNRHRLSNLVGIGAGTVSNYLLSRHWVFR